MKPVIQTLLTLAILFALFVLFALFPGLLPDKHSLNWIVTFLAGIGAYRLVFDLVGLLLFE